MGVPYAEVIGDPIAHSKSPLIHKFWLDKLGLDGDYRALRVGAGELVHYLELRRRDPDWRGCNATMPLKSELHELLANAEYGQPDLSGAYNCAFPRRFGIPQDALPLDLALVGTNTDHVGLIEPFAHRVPHPGPVVVIGNGGAARTAVASLSVLELGESVVVARNPDSARKLLDDLRLPGRVQSLDDPLPPASVLVNASPLGMRGYPALDLDLDPLPGHAIVFDLVYAPPETGLIRAARLRGLDVIDGLTMLVGQARLSFQLFFQQTAPREHDAELRELLVQ